MTVLAGKYRLGERIGGGGMAEVLFAELVGAKGFARKVAVKRVLGALSRDPRFGEMFVNEARLASLLHHPNIVSVLDFDRDEDSGYYLVMELVHGLDLRRLAESGRIPVHVSTYLTVEVLRGLAYAHELVEDGRHLGIVHRDVSPHNVMVSWSGAVKLVDFGIAKAFAATGPSSSRSLKGKVAYMSPEQAHGRDLDGRSDVFAVGVMLHELLTGRRLFDGETEAEILARLLTQPIEAPSRRAADVPGDLDRVTMSLLERDRDRRTASARLALEALLSSGAMSARAGVDLVEILRARFPGEVPASADLSGPVRAGSSGPVRAASADPSGPVRADAGLVADIGTAPTIVADGPALPRSPSADQTVSFAAEPVSARPVARPAARGPAARVPVVVLALAAAVVAAAVWIGASGRRAKSEPASGAARVAASEVAADAWPPAAGADLDADAPLDGRQWKGAGDAAPSSPAAAAAGPDAAPSSPAAAPSSPAAASPSSLPSTSRRASDKPGTLKVLVEPWALVTIDGKSYGQTPVVVDLPPGRYRVDIENADFGRRERVRVKVRSRRIEIVRRKWGTAF